MNNGIAGRDVLNLRDFTPEQWRYLVNLSWELKAQKKSGIDQRYFTGKNVIANFMWSSTRTRCAFESSCSDLGMGFTYLTNSHLGYDESAKDAIRVLSGMYDLLVIRAQLPEEFLYDIADYCDIPVINALTLDDHPTQMLADALTMEEEWGGLGSSRHKTMAYVGNSSSMPHYYGRLCAILGMNFRVVQPENPRYQLRQPWIDEIEELYKKWHPECEFTVTSDLDAVEDVDVITTEVWRYRNPDVSNQVLDPEKYDSWMGDVKDLFPYQVNSKLCERTGNPNIFCMHELPSVHNADHTIGKMLLEQAPNEQERKIVEEGLEISDECFEKNARVIFREAENRQHTIKAIMAAVLGL
jgi:ornithine carbamoyltransferase